MTSHVLLAEVPSMEGIMKLPQRNNAKNLGGKKMMNFLTRPLYCVFLVVDILLFNFKIFVRKISQISTLMLNFQVDRNLMEK